VARLAAYGNAYREYWRLNYLTLLEYKANFFIWLAFTVVYVGSSIAALWVILSQFRSLNGWDLPQVFFLYALFYMAHTLSNTFFFSVGQVPYQVREGEFDRFLVRPLNPLFQVLTQPGQNWPDDLLVAIVVFGFAAWLVHLHWTLASTALILGAMFGGALIDFGIQLAIATLSFWVIRFDSLRWVVMSLENDFTRYPLSIYNRAVRIVLAYVLPFAFMNYFPATTLLHKSFDGGYAVNPSIGWLSPVVGIVWFAGAYLFWRRGVNRYQGTGS